MSTNFNYKSRTSGDYYDFGINPATYQQYLGDLDDLDDLLEPYRSASPYLPVPDFSNFYNNGVSMANRYSGGHKSWEKTIINGYGTGVGAGYYNGGTPIPACLKGYRPSITNCFWTAGGTTGGSQLDLYLSRTDSALTITGSTSATFTPSDFWNNKVPMCIGVAMTGGGGRGVTDGRFRYGGNAGGLVLFVLSFENLTDQVYIELGAHHAASFLYIGGTRILYAERGGDGEFYGPGEGKQSTTHPNVFWIAGGKGAAGLPSYNVTRTQPGCPFVNSIAEGDPNVQLGTPPKRVEDNFPYGGPCMNGSYVTGGGSKGSGGAGGSSLGGSGYLRLYY